MWSAGLKKADAEMKSFSSQATSAMLSLGAAVAGVFGTKAALSAADQDVRAMQRLEAVLRATGGAAGMTAKEIGAYASELQRTTNFGDEATVQAAALLGTFRQLGGDQFKRTLSLAQDLAELKEIGLTEAANQLGKALNDPIQGLAMLRKIGIQFTAEEKERTKAMAAAGDMIGAQNVMLKAMGEMFGGTAASAASAMTQIQNYIGDVGEEIGKRLLPLMKLLAEAAKDFLPQWGPWIARAVVAIAGFVAALKTIQVAQKAIAVTQALVMSLAGPKGWAQLAVGAAVFAGAVAGIEIALSGVADAAKEAAGGARQLAADVNDVADAEERVNDAMKRRDELRKGNDRFNQLIQEATNPQTALEKQLAELDALAKLGGLENANIVDVIRQSMIRDATGYADALERISDEIAILNGMSQDELMIQKMLDKGLSEEDADALRRAIQLRDELKKLQEKDGKTPGSPGSSAPAGSFAALQKGSTDALSAVFKAMRGDDIQKKQLDAEEEQVEIAARQEALLRDIKDGGNNLGQWVLPA